MEFRNRRHRLNFRTSSIFTVVVFSSFFFVQIVSSEASSSNYSAESDYTSTFSPLEFDSSQESTSELAEFTESDLQEFTTPSTGDSVENKEKSNENVVNVENSETKRIPTADFKEFKPVTSKSKNRNVSSRKGKTLTWGQVMSSESNYKQSREISWGSENISRNSPQRSSSNSDSKNSYAIPYYDSTNSVANNHHYQNSQSFVDYHDHSRSSVTNENVLNQLTDYLLQDSGNAWTPVENENSHNSVPITNTQYSNNNGFSGSNKNPNDYFYDTNNQDYYNNDYDYSNDNSNDYVNREESDSEEMLHLLEDLSSLVEVLPEVLREHREDTKPEFTTTQVTPTFENYFKTPEIQPIVGNWNKPPQTTKRMPTDINNYRQRQQNHHTHNNIVHGLKRIQIPPSRQVLKSKNNKVFNNVAEETTTPAPVYTTIKPSVVTSKPLSKVKSWIPRQIYSATTESSNNKGPVIFTSKPIFTAETKSEPSWSYRTTTPSPTTTTTTTTSKPVDYEYDDSFFENSYYEYVDTEDPNWKEKLKSLPEQGHNEIQQKAQRRTLDLLYHMFVDPTTDEHGHRRNTLIEDVIKAIDNHIIEDIRALRKHQSGGKPGQSHFNQNKGDFFKTLLESVGFDDNFIRSTADAFNQLDESTSSSSTTSVTRIPPSQTTTKSRRAPSVKKQKDTRGRTSSGINSPQSVQSLPSGNEFLVTGETGKSQVISIDDIVNSLAALDENEAKELLLGPNSSNRRSDQVIERLINVGTRSKSNTNSNNNEIKVSNLYVLGENGKSKSIPLNTVLPSQNIFHDSRNTQHNNYENPRTSFRRGPTVSVQQTSQGNDPSLQAIQMLLNNQDHLHQKSHTPTTEHHKPTLQAFTYLLGNDKPSSTPNQVTQVANSRIPPQLTSSSIHNSQRIQKSSPPQQNNPQIRKISPSQSNKNLNSSPEMSQQSQQILQQILKDMHQKQQKVSTQRKQNVQFSNPSGTANPQSYMQSNSPSKVYENTQNLEEEIQKLVSLRQQLSNQQNKRSISNKQSVPQQSLHQVSFRTVPQVTQQTTNTRQQATSQDKMVLNSIKNLTQTQQHYIMANNKNMNKVLSEVLSQGNNVNTQKTHIEPPKPNHPSTTYIYTKSSPYRQAVILNPPSNRQPSPKVISHKSNERQLSDAEAYSAIIETLKRNPSERSFVSDQVTQQSRSQENYRIIDNSQVYQSPQRQPAPQSFEFHPPPALQKPVESQMHASNNFYDSLESLYVNRDKPVDRIDTFSSQDSHNNLPIYQSRPSYETHDHKQPSKEELVSTMYDQVMKSLPRPIHYEKTTTPRTTSRPQLFGFNIPNIFDSSHSHGDKTEEEIKKESEEDEDDVKYHDPLGLLGIYDFFPFTRRTKSSEKNKKRTVKPPTPEEELETALKKGNVPDHVRKILVSQLKQKPKTPGESSPSTNSRHYYASSQRSGRQPYVPRSPYKPPPRRPNSSSNRRQFSGSTEFRPLRHFPVGPEYGHFGRSSEYYGPMHSSEYVTAHSHHRIPGFHKPGVFKYGHNSHSGGYPSKEYDSYIVPIGVKPPPLEEQPLFDLSLLFNSVKVKKVGKDNKSISLPKVGDPTRFVNVHRPPKYYSN